VKSSQLGGKLLRVNKVDLPYSSVGEKLGLKAFVAGIILAFLGESTTRVSGSLSPEAGMVPAPWDQPYAILRAARMYFSHK